MRIISIVILFFAFAANAYASYNRNSSRIDSSWLDYIDNFTKNTVYGGYEELELDKSTAPSAYVYVHLKPHEKGSIYLYDVKRNISHSILDYRVVDPYTPHTNIALLEWDDDEPFRVKTCIKMPHSWTGDFGFNMDYWGPGNSKTELNSFSEGAEEIGSDDYICQKLLDFAKKHNPKK